MNIGEQKWTPTQRLMAISCSTCRVALATHNFLKNPTRFLGLEFGYNVGTAWNGANGHSEAVSSQPS